MISESADTYTLRYDVRDGEPARLTDSASWVATDVDEPFALGLLETHLHGTVAFQRARPIFIHGGAVGYKDRMIVLPAAALTGKTTLVAALVRAGATYYSDQFAVLDGHGQVHPYAVPLRYPGADQFVAGQNGDQGDLAGVAPLPVGAIVPTSYRPGAEWRPRQLFAGRGRVALMSQTVPAMDRPDESMHYIRHALEADPLVIESDRDEAEPWRRRFWHSSSGVLPRRLTRAARATTRDGSFAQGEALAPAGPRRSGRRLVSITVLAALLRFPTLSTQSYWYDEIVTVGLLKMDLGGMLSAIPDSENTPPLYYLLAWAWSHVFGTGSSACDRLGPVRRGHVPVVYLAFKELVSPGSG